MAVFNEKKQRADFLKVLRICMARRGFETYGDLAAHIPMPANCLSNRICWRTAWTLKDLWKLFRALKPTAEEIATMMGVIGNA